MARLRSMLEKLEPAGGFEGAAGGSVLTEAEEGVARGRDVAQMPGGEPHHPKRLLLEETAGQLAREGVAHRAGAAGPLRPVLQLLGDEVRRESLGRLARRQIFQEAQGLGASIAVRPQPAQRRPAARVVAGPPPPRPRPPPRRPPAQRPRLPGPPPGPPAL